MRIHTRAGELAFSAFTFPDGQPHFRLDTYEREFNEVTIETAIRNPAELFQVQLVCSVLRSHGYSTVNLDIRYLMGARMDRAISSSEPFTLSLVAQVLNSCGFSQVRILDVHSEVALRLIRGAINIIPRSVFGQAWQSSGQPFIVCPDKGAAERVKYLAGNQYIIYCTKERDPHTGKLSHFRVQNGTEFLAKGEPCLIVDDICDGGGTFIGLSQELRKAGACSVNLFITHGIFSRGFQLEGIDKVFTTDSYYTPVKDNNESRPICIPVSMKDMRC